MSLHKFAEQVAANGRGDDSLLVHMTPDEVRNLQRFAEANGTTLTINPTTGLPEAGLLSDLFKSLAPIALGAFLGPAGAAIGGGFLTAAQAGLAVGGITSLATGSLSRGLMAGLGAYGGAGIGASMMGAGETAIGAAAEGIQGPVGSPESGFGATQAIAAAPKADVLSAGFNAAKTNPMAFAKQNLTNIGMAAAPLLAMQPTTEMPEPKDTGYIRQFDYNINPDTGKPDPLYGMRAMTPVKASEFKGKTFQGQRDLFRQQNPNPYELGVGSLNQPPQQQPAQMNTGGIVALAEGGVPGYAGTEGSLVSDPQIFDYFKGLDQGQLQSGALDAKIAADMQTYNVSAADIARATGTQANQSDFETRFVNAIATPGITADKFNEYTADVGLTGQNLATALQNSGLSQAAQYSLTHGLNDATGIVGAPKSAQDLYNAFGYQAGDLKGDAGGLAGYYSNINQVAGGLQSLIDSGKLTVQQAQNLSLAEMERLGMSQKDIKAATGKEFGNLFTPKTIEPIKPIKPITSVIPGGTYGRPDGKTPGDVTTNPDGSVTVHPNIPYRPDGGFSGIGEVRDAWEAGGGSLGYTSPVVKTPAEHEAAYNRMTDDSLDAYRFLMGEGKNLTQRKAETRDRPVMQRYDEAVLGRKIVSPAANKAATKKTVTGVPGNPQSYFNEAEYLAANPDVAAELKTGKSVSGEPTKFTSGYEHYLMYGKAGGRAFTGDYEGYTTAAALANAANAGGGGEAPATPGANNSNTISGFTPAAPDTSIPDTVASPDSVNGLDAKGGYYSRGKLNYRSKDMAMGGATGYAMGGGLGSLGSYSDGGRLLRGPGDGVSDSIPATIGAKQQPARLADGEFVIPARIVSELGNGSTDAGAKKLYAMMDRVQRARGKTTGKNKVAANSRSDKYLPA